METLVTVRFNGASGFEAINPFKQVPAIDDDGYILTESGAILLDIAEKSGKFVPRDLHSHMSVSHPAK